MASQEEFEALKGRIEELENKLAAAQPAAASAKPEITAEELQAFVKVRDVIAMDWGENCGINECMRCVVNRCVTACVTRCITVCSFECTCGPCNVGPMGLGNLGRFGGLGG